MSWDIERIARIVAFSLIFYVTFNYVFKRWGEVIRNRLEASVEWLVHNTEIARATYVRFREYYSPTQQWLLVHLIPLLVISTAASANRVFGLEIPIRSLFMAAAAAMLVEVGIPMYWMRGGGMKNRLLFTAMASIVIFKPWEYPLLMLWLGNTSTLALLIVLIWHPDEILERIKRALNMPFDEGEFLAKLKTHRGFLLILTGMLVRIAQWVTDLVQDWVLQVNFKQLLMLPFTLIVAMSAALLLQYPQYPPLAEFAPKAVALSAYVVFLWTILWSIRWFGQVVRRFMSIVNHARDNGYSANVLGSLVTISAIVGLGLTTTTIGIRFVPPIVGEGTAWLYEALPYFDAVGNFAARIIAALT